MRIPKSITIGGHIYTIEFRERQRNDGDTAPATANFAQQKIWIEKDQHKEEQETSLLHEIIEVVNYYYALKLDHDQITRIEGALYPILKVIEVL